MSYSHIDSGVGTRYAQVIMSSDKDMPNVHPPTPDSPVPPLSCKTLKEGLVDWLVSTIQSKRYSVGDKLPSEKQLSELLGVGRSTVREALHALVALGLVESHHGKGYFLGSMSIQIPTRRMALSLLHNEKQFLDLMEARELLEPEVAALAADRSTPEDLQNLQTTYSEVESRLTRGGVSSTGKIHLAIAEATHNEVICFIMRELTSLFPGSRNRKTVPVQEHLRMHKELVDAVSGGDSAAAAAAMKEHLRQTRALFYIAVSTQDVEEEKPAENHGAGSDERQTRGGEIERQLHGRERERLI